MRVYTYSEARREFADLLSRAWREGEVQVRRRDGRVFVVRPSNPSGSPLDVPGVDAGLSRQEVVNLVRESRRSTGRFLNQTAPPGKRPPGGRKRNSTRTPKS